MTSARSLLSSAVASLCLPRRYDDIKPHHLLAVYYGIWLVTCTDVYRRMAVALLHSASRFSERCIGLVYSGWIPDLFIRYGIRLQLKSHLEQLSSAPAEEELAAKMAVVDQLREMPVAVQTDAANQQHYEVPADFYDLCLGPFKKYSSGYWPLELSGPPPTLAASEIAMLDLYCQRAQIEDGMKIVDLGCGWGSLTLYLAERFPQCHITSISNSASQRQYILDTAARRQLPVHNIQVITCDMANDGGALDQVREQDLVMSIEMFEHMKNYQNLLGKVASFLKTSGRLFLHIFSHRDFTYAFDKGWMSDNFFTGGTMPSDDLLLYFAKDFAIKKHWRVNGTHYEKTCNGWLSLLDKNWKNGMLQPVLARAYGQGKEMEWYINWRLFFMACAELFGLDGGEQWMVSHYLFERR